MDSDDESDNDGPHDRFFVDPDIHQITRAQLGVVELLLDDLFTVSHTALRTEIVHDYPPY